MRTRMISLVALSAVAASGAACSSWLTDTKCDSSDDCGGGLVCDLSQSPGRCVESLSPQDAASAVGQDVGVALPGDAAEPGAEDAGAADGGGLADSGAPQPPTRACTPQGDDAGGVWCVYQPLPDYAGELRGVWASSESNVWLVGQSYEGRPTVIHWNGAQWEDLGGQPFSGLSADAGMELRTVGGWYGDGAAVVAGDNGITAAWKSATRSFQTHQQTGVAFTASWSAPDTDAVFFAGTPKTLLDREPGGDSVCTAPTANVISIAGNSYDEWYAFDETGQSLLMVGTSQEQSLGSAHADAEGIWIIGDDYYLAYPKLDPSYGLDGCVVRCTVAAGSALPENCSSVGATALQVSRLWGVGGFADDTLELWAVGTSTSGGNLSVYRDGAWTALTGAGSNYRAIWGLGAGKVVAVGKNGRIYVHWTE